MRIDTRTPPAPATAVPPSPTPARRVRPRWINVRVVVGLLLVVGSVVAGSRLLAADRETIEVWSVRVDLAAGAILAEDDVEPVVVRLGTAADRYLTVEASPPIGQVVNQSLRSGELLPAGAIGTPEEGRVVVLPVDPDRMPDGVVHGSTVDVYLEREAADGASGTERVLDAVTVQAVSGDSGGLSSVGGTVQVSISLNPAQAEQLVLDLADSQVLLVLVTGR